MSETIILNNRYKIEEPLGSGGMAVVYRARDLTLERTVAVKILRQNYSTDAGFRARFHHEAKAAANLSHPNIVTVHDFGYYADQLYIVMEYVPGVNLKSRLAQSGKFGLSEALDLIIQACAGIGYAHRAGLVHCDIKPQNLLITPDRRLKVVDFGIARALATISPDEKTEVVWGSPQYFSPEQAAGLAPLPASDVYSLGVVFFEMLAGRLPFVAASPDELARMHRETPPPSLHSFNPAVPLTLEQIILKVLSKEPSARYRTADQFGRVLAAWSQQNITPGITGTVNTKTQPAPSAPAAVPPATKPVRSVPAPLPANNSAGARPLPSSRPIAVQRSQEDSRVINPTPQVIVIDRSRKSAGFDWLTAMLVLLALIAVGGLIPFWLWVLSVLSNPL
jgi:eukaryotic-like serine/threonine-protein kinase